MPYRDTHPVKVDPRFSYVEKCFISGSQGKRALGHMLLLGKTLVSVFIILLTIIFAGAATLGAGYLFISLCKVISKSINIEVEGAVIILLGAICIIVCAANIIKQHIKSNSEMIQYRINEKIRLSEMKLEELPSDTDSGLFYNRCMSELESLKEEIKVNERVSKR